MLMHEVKTEIDKKLFLEVVKDIYKNDPNWVRPLNKDIEEVFNPNTNKFLKRGNACARWVLLDYDNKAIGRIAAFINKQYKQVQPTGGVGFFECIKNQTAANYMFDHCKNWLQQQGMEAMDGPINFGERDKWWGLLTSGFHEPLYCMNYNPPYYQQLFESYGFITYFNQICFGMKVQDKLLEKFARRHELFVNNPDYRAEHIKLNQIERYAKDFTYIYNKAWAGHGEGKSMEEKHAIKMFKNMQAVIDEHIIWFTYHKNQPIAFWINLPDLNQHFKHMNGSFNLLNKIHLLWLQYFGKCTRFVGLVFGIIPEYHGMGVDAFMIVEAAKLIQKEAKYIDYEMQWIGDFHPKMINVAESLCSNRTRNLITYRYLFDRSKPFERHPILGK